MPIEEGKPAGLYDANSVRDRIRQWQSQGGGVIGPEETDSENGSISRKQSKEDTQGRRSEPRRPTRKTSVKEATTPSRTGRSTSKADDATKDRKRSGSAPAKRVVSDQHWRKKLGVPDVDTPLKTTRKPSAAPNVPDEGIQVKPEQEPISEEKGNEIKSTPNARPSAKGDPSSRGTGRRSGTRVSQSESRKGSHQPKGRRDEELDHVTVDASNFGSPESKFIEESETKNNVITPPTSGRKTSWTHTVGSRRRRLSLRKDDETEESKTRHTLSDTRGSQRSRKGNILNEIFARNAPEPTISPRVPSIEQWLHDTSDPFVDAEDSQIENIAPLRPSTQKRKVTPKERILENPNQIWESVSPKEGTRKSNSGSRRSKRISSSNLYEGNPFPEDFDSGSGLDTPTKGAKTETASKLVDLAKGSSEQSPSLSRRGANKSASTPLARLRKSRRERNVSDHKDRVSPTASIITESSVEELNPIAPLQPPRLGNRRPFPSTGGHRLSTIASVETFNTRGQDPASCVSNHTVSLCEADDTKEETAEEARDQFDPYSLGRKNSRLTKHSDLISVLSQPRIDSKSIQSARSVRTNRTRLTDATIESLMQELATDETKYMRELRTLVDGVIPVLLTCVLSKSDSAVAAGLFRSSCIANADPNFTKPIIDMGIALERLKTLHKRIPINPNGFLTWAHGAQRVYTEYLKAWRMGFQDVVVNLAPANDTTKGVGLEEGLPRNAEGDVTNGDGERVDVAFLLKRPLVRLKHLSRTLKGIETLQTSIEAKGLSIKYQKLVEEARQRSNEERARLEDEAAANIDATRARDVRTLAPVTGVIVDGTGRVRARDHFDLALQHSSGQLVDCRVEMLLRDEASGKTDGSDVLVCEVDGTGRWLLFPPVGLDRISARNGELKGEIIVMIRGTSSGGIEWQELFSLISEDENAGFEWVQMLGLDPVPPTISRSQSFINKHQVKKHKAVGLTVPEQDEIQNRSGSPGKSRTPSPREVDVPIGERAQVFSETVTKSNIERYGKTTAEQSPKRLAQQHADIEERLPSTPTRISMKQNSTVDDLQTLPSQSHGLQSSRTKNPSPPRSFKEALGLSGSSNSMGLKRASAKRVSKHGDASHKARQSPTSSPTSSIADKIEFDAPPSPLNDLAGDLKDSTRPPARRSLSSTPSTDLPFIPKSRTVSPSVKPEIHSEEEPAWSSPPLSRLPTSPNKLTKKRPNSSRASPETSPVTPSLDLSNTPNLEQTNVKQRRSSSPLKHEYEPSTASDTSSDSGASTVEHNDATSISDDSSEEELEEGDAPTALLPLGALRRFSKSAGKQSLHSNTNGSIKPSESASQAPYKTVPAQPAKAGRTIASIFTWLDEGRWEQLHPDECSIFITPGLIEAFEMSAAHSDAKDPASSTPTAETERNSDLASTTTSQNDEVRGDRPLVALELTPLVPLRRGTALDISIRSPPTPQSQIRSGNNIMFRSRNPEECEALYALINHSRIHNPTFIALQNARGPYASGGIMGGGPRSRHPSSQAGSHRSSWFNGWGRSSSYRASSGRTPSVVQSESSIGSLSSAFSALKRFSAHNNGMFNIAKSTIGSRTGSRANSVYTSSDHSSGSGTNSPVPPGMIADARKDALIGLTDAKIRIYIRETASRWRDMGSARLTIKRAEVEVLGPDGRPVSSGAGGGARTRQIINEKRIIVHGKTKGEVLLDVQLGESCFERVARTGIAVSVWEDVVGPNGEVGTVNAVGGVAGGRAKVYMIQMKSEAETAYTFSLVGKLRY